MFSLKIGGNVPPLPPPPPGMEKLKSKVNVTFWLSGQSDILVLADVPPPPPPRNGKVEISGQSDILVLADVPPPPRNGNWTKHECYRTKIISREVIKYILQSTPSPLLPEPLSDSIPEQETGEFQFKMDMDIWTRTPPTTPLQPKK